MRAIGGLLQLIGLLVVLVGGYWVYYANWAKNPNDQIGVAIAPLLPAPARDWGCGKLAGRFGTEAPTVCSAAAGSAPSTAPTPEGGGRL